MSKRGRAPAEDRTVRAVTFSHRSDNGIPIVFLRAGYWLWAERHKYHWVRDVALNLSDEFGIISLTLYLEEPWLAIPDDSDGARFADGSPLRLPPLEAECTTN